MKNQNKITLNFIIDEETFPVEANLNQPLKVARDKALRDADRTGRPSDDWEIRYQGKPLSAATKIEDLGLPDGAEMELILGFGAGG